MEIWFTNKCLLKPVCCSWHAFCRTKVFVHTVHQMALGKQKCNFNYKCLSQSVLRILHLAFGGIVWPALVWNHKAPPPRHIYTLAGRGIGPVRSGWSSYKHLSLSFRTLHLKYANTKGRQKTGVSFVKGF